MNRLCDYACKMFFCAKAATSFVCAQSAADSNSMMQVSYRYRMDTMILG